MALSVITSPPAVGLAYNPMALVVQTDNYITTAGVKASAIINFNGDIGQNETISFSWNGKSVTFLSKLAPDKSGTQIQVSQGDFMDDWTTQYFIVRGLRSNYDLNEDFDIEMTAGDQSTSTVKLTAKNPGSAYTLSISHGLTNVTLGTNTAGVDEVKRDNFKVLADIYIEDVFGSGTFTKANELDSPADDTGHAIFRIERTLRAYLSGDMPAWNSTAMAMCMNMMKRYYLRYAEKYGSPAEVQFVENGALDVKLALLARLNYPDFPGNTFQSSYITATSSRKFLTAQPRRKKVAVAQQEYLYIYSGQITGKLELYANVTNTDGSVSVNKIAEIDSTQKQFYRIPAGYNQLGIGSINTAKTVEKYEVYVRHSAAAFESEKFTFVPDFSYQKYDNFLLFMSKLGGFDTLRCTGVWAEGREIEEETFEQFLPYNYAATEAVMGRFDVTDTQEWEFNSGWVTREYWRYLVDQFFTSEQIYLSDGSRFLPVQMAERQVKPHPSDEFQYSISFKLISAFKN